MHRSVLSDPEIEILDDEALAGASTRHDTPGFLVDADGVLVPAIGEPDALRFPVADSVRRLADRTGTGVDSAMFRWHRRWSRFARVGDIRAQSRLRLHAWSPLPDLIDRLGDAPIELYDRHHLLLQSAEPLTPWRRGAYRTEATLSLRWSWPDLPVWIVAEPWWREHTVVTLSLRTTNRVRYPRRYWEGAHLALRLLVRSSGTGAGR